MSSSSQRQAAERHDAVPPPGWIDFAQRGRVSIRTGKVELGQGIVTALATIAASGLSVSPDRIDMVSANTDESPDEGTTSGSQSVSDAGMRLRQACHQLQDRLLSKAAEDAGVPVEGLCVRDGCVIDSAGVLLSTYWTLTVTRGSSDVVAPPVPDGLDQAGRAGDPRAAPGEFRLDLPDKIMARARFIQDIRLEGQCFGRVVRPPSLGSHLLDVAWPTTDQRADAETDTVRVVRKGDFLGVVSDREESAMKSASLLRTHATWSEGPTLPVLPPETTSADAYPSLVVHHHGADGFPIEDESYAATYSRGFLAHASVGTSCAVAVWEDTHLTVWSHSQGIFNLRHALALAFAVPEDDITVRHAENAGCYGHNGADDAAFDAALLALNVPGRPVHLTWGREDELAWSPLGPAMKVHLRASLDRAGKISAWRHEGWSQGHTSRPGTTGLPRLLGHSLMLGDDGLPPAADPPAQAGFGGGRNAVPLYDVPSCTVVTRLVSDVPVRTSSLRSLGSHCNTFAIESFMDELAAGAAVDPVEFRLRHLTDPRALDVLQEAAEMSSWWTPREQENVALGVGLSRYKGAGAYCAVVAQVEAHDRVSVQRLWAAVDVGEVITADGVINQIEGGAIQAASWTILEEVRFDSRGVSSRNWDDYPVIRFVDVPLVEVRILHRLEPPVGAGEAAMGPTSAAIANAIRAVLGVGLRDLPFTDERIRSALAR